MKKKVLNDLVTILRKASYRLEMPFEIKVEEDDKSTSSFHNLYVYSPNRAYRHELNMLMAALESLLRVYTQQNRNGNIFDGIDPDTPIWYCY